MSSMSNTRRPESGSWEVPRYSTMCGCFMSLRNSHSCSNLLLVVTKPGSLEWKKMGCRSLAAQRRWPHMALQTAP